jgi:hypothetical protein
VGGEESDLSYALIAVPQPSPAQPSSPLSPAVMVSETLPSLLPFYGLSLDKTELFWEQFFCITFINYANGDWVLEFHIDSMFCLSQNFNFNILLHFFIIFLK